MASDYSSSVVSNALLSNINKPFKCLSKYVQNNLWNYGGVKEDEMGMNINKTFLFQYFDVAGRVIRNSSS